jgi:hypothetical protein
LRAYAPSGLITAVNAASLLEYVIVIPLVQFVIQRVLKGLSMLILASIRRYIENAVPELWTRQGVIDDESGKN